MTLKAHANKHKLTAWGTAARGKPHLIEIRLYEPSIADNDAARTLVDINPGHARISWLNVRGIENAGVEVTGDSIGDTVHLTNQDDRFDGGYGDDWASGYRGADKFEGWFGNDTFFGLHGDDTLEGEWDDDLLGGGAGDDMIDGGEGEDIAIYSGDRDDYDIRFEDGAFVVEDLRDRAPDGTDRVINVETLRFADQDYLMAEGPTKLEARGNGKYLVISGEAEGGVAVEFAPGSVRDGGADLYIPIQGNYDELSWLDARGIENAGVHVYASGYDNVAHLTQNNDRFYGYNGDDRAVGYGGDDDLHGHYGNDTLIGLDGDDELWGGEEDDLLVGGAGNDRVDGGLGDDIAVYSGNRADYDIRIVQGVFVIEDLRPGSPDGSDLFGNVETLRFADQDYAMLDTATRLTVELDGTRLTVGGSAADGNGSKIGITLFEHSAGYAPLVYDNGIVSTLIAPGGGGFDAPVTTLYVRQLEGAGAFVRGTHWQDVVHLSNQNDFFDGSWGDDWAAGYRGNDTFYGRIGNDTLLGMQGNDWLDGGDDNDLLIGGSGDDRLDGGAGTDIAVFGGLRSDYDIRTENGFLLVEDLRGGSPDGTDSLANIETLRFADQDYTLAEGASVAPLDSFVLGMPDQLLF